MASQIDPPLLIGCETAVKNIDAHMGVFTDAKGDGGFAVMDKDESPRVMIGSGPTGSGIMLIGAGLTELPAVPKPDKD